MSSPSTQGDKSWLKMSPNLLQGLTLINEMDSQKFQLLLNRLVQSIHQNPDSITPFTEEEELKLVVSLNIDKVNLQHLLNTMILILSKTIYNITKPAQLQILLRESLQFDEEKAAIFVSVWTNNAKRLVGKLKQKKIFSTQLDDVSWLMNIETSSDSGSQTFIPKALLQLKLKESQGTSMLNLDLDEQQLFKLYNVLETIQSEIDSLH